MNTMQLFDYYHFDYMEEEGCYIKNVYNASFLSDTGFPCASHAIGIYCNKPKSFSRFHMLEHDELWHFYGGAPFHLYLLFPDGSIRLVRMGSDLAGGEHLHYLVSAGTWQAGELCEGEYALFACSMAPAFDPSIFHFRDQAELKRLFPAAVEWIDRL